MAYKGRVGVAGNYDGNPFVGFVLASRSEPDRKLVVDEKRKRVWVAPGEDVTAKLKEGDFTAVDNIYACLIGFYDAEGRPVAVSFNGRMSNAVERMMRRGETAEAALTQILHVFVPEPGDPRIGVTSYFEEKSGKHVFRWGIHDRTDEQPKPYFVVGKTEIGPNKAMYVPLTSCKKPFADILDLDSGRSLDELSQQLFEQILGPESEFGCGAAICMIHGNAFLFGAYNWRAKND